MKAPLLTLHTTKLDHKVFWIHFTLIINTCLLKKEPKKRTKFIFIYFIFTVITARTCKRTELLLTTTDAVYFFSNISKQNSLKTPGWETFLIFFNPYMNITEAAWRNRLVQKRRLCLNNYTLYLISKKIRKKIIYSTPVF